MIEVFALKNEHTLYHTLRELVKGISHEAHIIGLDEPHQGMNLPYYHDNNLYSKPFLLYLEEYGTFGRPDIISHENFRGFISHIKSICERLHKDFGCKVFHLPLSSSNKNFNQINKHINSLGNRSVNLVALGSWNDIADNNFNNRGGPAIDGLVTQLLDANCDIRFSMRTKVALGCRDKYPEKVDLYPNYQEPHKIQEILSQGDIFLLPSVQVHSMSLVQAMSYGMPCIVSDGWGMDEFCNGINSISIHNFDEIKETIQTPEKLKLKRINTLAFYRTNYSRANHIKNIKNILCKGVLRANS